MLVYIESALVPLILPSPYLQVKHELTIFYVDNMLFLSAYYNILLTY
jgi:hypothetical protein